ncbi:hypothetical protein ACFL6S_24730 [Candidatus Poribacteria bacterium]
MTDNQFTMKLTDMQIHEVSFVDAPANKRRFLLIKEVNKMEFMELLKSLTGLEIAEDDIKDEEFRKAISALGQYQDLMPEDLQDAVGHLVKRAVATAIKADENDTVSVKEPDQTSASSSTAEPISAETSLILKTIADMATATTGDNDSHGGDPLSQLKNTLESISTRLEVVEKTTAGKKSLDDDDGDDLQSIQKNDDRWPSLSPWLRVD